MNSNILKIIGIITMTVDHIGFILFPKIILLRVIGRLAFPVFAYMIAEGCHYTHDRKKYLRNIFLLALLCQVAYTVFSGRWYFNVLMTFTLSILLIDAYDYMRSQIGPSRVRGTYFFALSLVGVYAFTEILPTFLKAYEFDVDYGFFGVLLPLLIYLGRDKLEKLLVAALGLTLLALSIRGVQWWSLSALLIFALYNGRRGRIPMKYFFYLYYPAHLLVIEGIKMYLS